MVLSIPPSCKAEIIFTLPFEREAPRHTYKRIYVAMSAEIPLRWTHNQSVEEVDERVALFVCVFFVAFWTTPERTLPPLMNGADCRINGRRGGWRRHLLCRHQRCVARFSYGLPTIGWGIHCGGVLLWPCRRQCISFVWPADKRGVSLCMKRFVYYCEAEQSYHCACFSAVFSCSVRNMVLYV